MLIRLNIERNGGSVIPLFDKNYHFAPLEPNGPHVCDVTEPKAIERFLSIDGYTVATGASADEPPAELIEIEAGEMLTFGAVKSGFISLTILQAMGLHLLDQGLGPMVQIGAGSGNSAAEPRSEQAAAASILEGFKAPALQTATEQPPAHETPAAAGGPGAGITATPANTTITNNSGANGEENKQIADEKDKNGDKDDPAAEFAAMSDADLAALVKTTIGRGVAKNTARETMITAILTHRAKNA